MVSVSGIFGFLSLVKAPKVPQPDISIARKNSRSHCSITKNTLDFDDEIPYSIAVEIVEFERYEGKLSIRAESTRTLARERTHPQGA